MRPHHHAGAVDPVEAHNRSQIGHLAMDVEEAVGLTRGGGTEAGNLPGMVDAIGATVLAAQGTQIGHGAAGIEKGVPWTGGSVAFAHNLPDIVDGVGIALKPPAAAAQGAHVGHLAPSVIKGMRGDHVVGKPRIPVSHNHSLVVDGLRVAVASGNAHRPQVFHLAAGV